MAKNTQFKTPAVRESADFLLEKNDCGRIAVTERAIAMIVRNSAYSIPAVAKLSGNTLVDNIAELVGSKSMQDRAVCVKADENGVLTIEIAITIRYGYNLPETAAELQNLIAENVFAMTGLTVACVNVIVRDMEEPEENADAADEEGSDDGDLND